MSPFNWSLHTYRRFSIKHRVHHPHVMGSSPVPSSQPSTHLPKAQDCEFCLSKVYSFCFLSSLLYTWVFFLPALLFNHSLSSRSFSTCTSISFSYNTRHCKPLLSNSTQALSQALASSTGSAFFPPVSINMHCSVHHSELLPAALISAQLISCPAALGTLQRTQSLGKGQKGICNFWMLS